MREVIFEEGRVTEDLDRSREMKDLRARLTSEPLQPGLGDGQARIREWIEKCFSRDYSGMH